MVWADILVLIFSQYSLRWIIYIPGTEVSHTYYSHAVECEVEPVPGCVVSQGHVEAHQGDTKPQEDVGHPVTDHQGSTWWSVLPDIRLKQGQHYTY